MDHFLYLFPLTNTVQKPFHSHTRVNWLRFQCSCYPRMHPCVCQCLTRICFSSGFIAGYSTTFCLFLFIPCAELSCLSVFRAHHASYRSVFFLEFLFAISRYLENILIHRKFQKFTIEKPESLLCLLIPEKRKSK